MDKKRKLKEMFDAEYDEGESTYFDDLKGEMQKQAQVRSLSSSQPLVKTIIAQESLILFGSLLPILLLCLSFGLLGRDACECVYSCSELIVSAVRRSPEKDPYLFCNKN